MALATELEAWGRRGMRLSLPELAVRPPPKNFRLDSFVKVVAAVVVAVWTGELIQAAVKRDVFGALWTTEDVGEGAVFEYIVVGSGAGGSAVAGRLARAGRRVLLVEAGDEPAYASQIPALATTLFGTDMDWAYETISNNKSCLGMEGEACGFVRGRALGGSTSLNLMMYTRGNRRDFDFGVPGWSWQDMKPYFLRSQRLKMSPHFPESSSSYHNASGAVPVENFTDSGLPWHPRIVDGFRALNFPLNPDVNAASQIGVARIPGYVSGGARVTAATAYLRGDDVRKHLRVLKNARCVRVIIDEDNVARGVTVLAGRRRLDVFAEREVVLSAGAIGTPQVLMLSGIGPREHLERLRIPVRADLPVGEDMSDHAMSLALIKVDHGARSARNVLSLAAKGVDAARWLLTGGGPLATVGLGDITTFINTECYDYRRKRLTNNGSDCDVPTAQSILSYVDKDMVNLLEPVFKRITPFNVQITSQIKRASAESALVVASPVLLRPASRGRVRLAGADPLAPPAIFPNYLHAREDVAELARAMRIVRDLTETPVFEQHGASLLRLSFPGCPEYDAPGYWECYVRHMTLSVHHAVGTAALGRVVDAELRVRGVRALRVADASVLPLLPRGNTAAAVLAVGERLAALLLES